MSRLEPRGAELIRRYKDNYAIAEEEVVTEEMILAHWELEKALTRELMASTPETRRQTFETCYTRLYAHCEWLNRLTGTRDRLKPNATPVVKYALWAREAGPAPKRIYEVGSGRAELITFLASLGHDCTATEITRERGEKFTAATPNLRWELTDGVHLDRYAGSTEFDVVVSDQVIEHLHPDDLAEHFAAAARILRPGGLYLLGTPHRHFGPCDVSRVFGTPRPLGMHLREYTFGEVFGAMRAVGFERPGIPLEPGSLSGMLYRFLSPFSPDAGYRAAHVLAENIVALLPGQGMRRALWDATCRGFGLRPNIILSARKTGPA